MQPITKKVIAVMVSLIVLFVAVFGEYLPMRKAEMFITTLQSLQSNPPTSITELENRLSTPLDYASPIGQEELVRNMANSILGFVQNNQNASTTAELLRFLDVYYQPILARGRGMSFGQDLYLMGAIHELSFVRTGDKSYLDTAKQYYLLGNQLGPTRPQPLYGLFDVYRFSGDVANAQTTAEKILSLWPADKNIQAGLVQLQAMQAGGKLQGSSTKK